MKKLICLLLVAAMCMGLCGCDRSGFGIRIVQKLAEQEYSIAFRTDDPTSTYVIAALKALKADGTVDSLAIKWFGDKLVKIDSDAKALGEVGVITTRTFIIGVDPYAFPLAYAANGTYWGFDIELATVMCNMLGWTLQIQPIKSENVYIELSSGNIDCAWGGIVLNEKELAEHKYEQYGPYLHNDIVVASRLSSNVRTKLMLGGKCLAMPTTEEAMTFLTSDEKLVKRLGQITRLAGGTIECFEYLYAGKCDAVLTDSLAVHYYNCH